MAGGLSRICKLYGGLVAKDAAGKTVRWAYDYAADVPVLEAEMPFGSPRHAASERARYGYVPSPSVPQEETVK